MIKNNNKKNNFDKKNYLLMSSLSSRSSVIRFEAEGSYNPIDNQKIKKENEYEFFPI